LQELRALKLPPLQTHGTAQDPTFSGNRPVPPGTGQPHQPALPAGATGPAKSLPGNPYDGRTLQACIEQAERVSGIKPKEAYTDRGCRGHGCNTGTLKVWIAGAKRGVTAAIHRKLKRRNALEPVIGHMKSDGRLARMVLFIR
jgi:hypothetical protein